MEMSDELERGSMIKYLIGSVQTKFSVLEDLYRGFDRDRYKMMVLLVDAHTMMRKLHVKDRSVLLADNTAESVRDIVVGFLNVLGHYRRFMATRLGMDNDIYVMFNRRAPKYNRRCIAEFSEGLEHYYDPSNPEYGAMNRAVELAYQFIMGLSPYFEGIYCLDMPGVNEFALMARMGFPDDVYYTIVTRNRFGFQLIRDNVSVLRPKRDDSYLLTAKNFYDRGILRETKQRGDPRITPDMLPLFWTLTGLGDVEVGGTEHVTSVSQMTRIAIRMLDEGALVPGISIQSFLKNLTDFLPPKKRMAFRVDSGHLGDRYRGLSANLAGYAITPDQMAKVVAQCYDLYDETALEDLNQKLVDSSVNPETLALENLNMSFGVNYE